ncbi:MAG: SF3a splicing factor complex subunit [Peltula sp. TS41687]|nr:MAG: SF3a splicing factor complex subunit [Peltula sp. TS41687]
MTPSAVNGDEAAATIGTEEISKPPAGVVLPPKDIRAILEKTAGYVARNGAVFEDRIREKEKHNPKFSFLSPNDAYSGFYAWRLKEIREGRGTSIAAGRPGEAVAAATTTTTTEPEKPKGPAEPPEFHFSARMPNISAQDLDVVRLTALFVAKNGRPFMTTLSQRETRNFQFDFLRPNHSLYQFFTRLVDQYTELLRYDEGGKAEKERMGELERNVEDRFRVLGRAKQRAEWARFQEQQKQKKEEEEEKEKLTYAQIDWHDFVVVETVLFNEADDQADLPAPTSLNDLQSASLEQKAMMSLAPHNMRIEEAMPTEEDTYYNSTNPYATNQQAPPPPMMQQPPPPPTHAYPPPPPPTAPLPTAMDISPPDDEDEESQQIRERAEARARARQAQAEAKTGAGAIKIRNDYVPRAAAAAAHRRGVQMALCPNCRQQMPVNELEEHMRIELLDPRWKEQREKAEQRYATTNLSTQDVANNLKRLASQRTDVFDPSIHASSSSSSSNSNNNNNSGGGGGGAAESEEDASRRKRQATNAAFHHDGGTAAAAMQDRFPSQQVPPQSLDVHQQIRTIWEKNAPKGSGGGNNNNNNGSSGTTG